MLAACGGLPGYVAPETFAEARPQVRPPVPKPTERPAPVARRAGHAMVAIKVAGEPQAVSFPNMDLKQMIGLSQADAFAMLGTPSEVREQSPATVWRYDIGPCQLDLYFYMDLGTNAFRVLTLDVRTAVPGDGGKMNCPAPVNAASHAR